MEKMPKKDPANSWSGVTQLVGDIEDLKRVRRSAGREADRMWLADAMKRYKKPIKKVLDKNRK